MNQRLKQTLVAAALLALTPVALSARLTDKEASRIVDAIYRVEGGPKAKVPYGILSIPVRDAAHARRICTNPVQNNHDRWVKAGRPGEYLDFLADRYCPPSADLTGNRNWKRNIRAILKGGVK
jgi:hypothetical protein